MKRAEGAAQASELLGAAQASELRESCCPGTPGFPGLGVPRYGFSVLQ